MKKMMQVLVVIILSLAATANAGDSSRSRLFGPDDTYPWGLEQPIPWQGMDGVWQARSSGAYYYFLTLGTKENRYLEVVQFAPGSCKVLASGYAFEDERVITGLLNSPNHDGDYWRINVHVFSTSDMPGVSGVKTKKVTVMNRTRLNSPAPIDTSVLIKLSRSITKHCSLK
jgi:hypothetical protein